MPYRVLFISHSGQSIGYGTNPTGEYGDRAITQQCHFRRSCIVSDRPVRGIIASSASISSTGANSGSASFCAPIERGLHGEVAARLDPGGALHRPAKKPTYQRSDSRGFTYFLTGEDPWLNPALGAACVSSLPPVTIATLRRSWRKFTGCWFPACVLLRT